MIFAGLANQNAEHEREHAKGAVIQFAYVIDNAHADLIGRQR
jgi:hypothetical protein